MNDATPAMQPPTAQPFAAWNPTRGTWETTQLDLYGLSAPFSAIWPTCGWMRDGSAYRLPLSALLTNASASSPSPGALSHQIIDFAGSSQSRVWRGCDRRRRVGAGVRVEVFR